MKKAPTTLIILDGFGLSEQSEGNAIKAANTPVLDRLAAAYAHTTLAAAGADVGLPAGQPGNSAVGHANIEAGRVVLQPLPQIDRAVAEVKLASLGLSVDALTPAQERYLNQVT